MSNITVKSEEYENIQGVAARRIKLIEGNYKTLLNEGSKSRLKPEPELKVEKEIDEVKLVAVDETKNEDDMPSYLHSNESKVKEYEFDENALKERVAENYKNLANFDKKIEKKLEVAPKMNLNQKIENFKKLINTDVKNVSGDLLETKNIISVVFEDKFNKLQELKVEKNQYADLFGKLSNDEQSAKKNKKSKEDRTKIMNDKKNFTYLTIGEEDEEELVEAIRQVNDALKNLYNVNQTLYKGLDSKIEKYEVDKKDINESSEKVGVKINAASEDISVYIDENTPVIENIIKIDNESKNAGKVNQKIRDEYKAIKEEENTKIGINLTMNDNQEMVQNEVPTMNVFENFRQAATLGEVKKVAAVDNNLYVDTENQVGYGRAL